MNQKAETGQPARSKETTLIFYYSITGLIVYFAALTYTFFEWRPILAYVALGAPVGAFIITQPKLAVYQYVFCLFVHHIVIGSIPLLLADISAVILILAAVLDVLVDNQLPRRVPRLTLNFACLLAAMILASLFGHDLMAGFRPVLRVTFLLVTFVAMYRLMDRSGVENLLKLYFWLCVVHSILVFAPFVAAGGQLRFFGLSGRFIDELAMLALPIGLSFFIWSKQGRGLCYLLGSAAVFLGVVATQSRAPIAFAGLAAIVVLYCSWKRAKKIKKTKKNPEEQLPEFHDARQGAFLARRRIRLIMILSVIGVSIMMFLSPGVFAGLLTRFDRLLTLQPGGTFALRLVLWKAALTAWVNNPVLGVGPGLFRSLPTIFPTMHLIPVFWYIKNLSAHNLFLHYLAETGLIGATALMALFVNQFTIGIKAWRENITVTQTGFRLSLFVTSLLFLITTLMESGWMWAQSGFIMVFFMALLASQATQATQSSQDSQD